VRQIYEIVKRYTERKGEKQKQKEKNRKRGSKGLFFLGWRVGGGVEGWCRVGGGFVSTLHPYVLPLFVGRFKNILINYETKVEGCIHSFFL